MNTSEPHLIDINALFGEPSPIQQSSGTIVDPRKHIATLKKITRKSKDVKPLKGNNKYTNATGNSANTEESAGAIKMGSAIKIGSALAFNEEQLQNDFANMKKGGALPALAAQIIPALIDIAPQIINSIKGIKKSGGAIKLGGASAVFLEGVDPAHLDDMEDLFKKIQRQKRNLIREGGAIKIGSGSMGKFFSNAWNKIKSWYGNNKDKLKPITDILINSAVDTANSYIDKGVNYVANKTGSDTLKQIGNVVGDMGKSYVKGVADTLGSGYDIKNISDEAPVKVSKKRGKKIISSLDNNQDHVTENVITRKSIY